MIRRLLLMVEVSDLEAGILSELVPDIAGLLERDHIPTAPELAGPAAQERLIETIIALLKRQTQHIVLILEDLQWASSQSLTILKKLTEIVGDLPLLVLGSYRNDEQPELPDQLPLMNTLMLHRFNESVIEKLSVSILGDAGSRSQVVGLLQKETEGNVFFLVEVIRALAENAGQLIEVGNITLPDHIITGGIQQIIQRRINNIPASAHPMLKLCAVIGRKLDLTLLRNVATPVELDEWFAACTNASILEVQENQWEFAHDKLRESVLRDLSEHEQRQFNQQAAELIEAAYGSDSAYAAILADHWQKAGNIVKEAYYASLACEKALSITAYQAYLAMGARALNGLPADDPTRVRVLRWMGDAHFGLAERTQAKECFETALALADQLNDQAGKAEVLYAMSTLAVNQGDFAGFEALVRQAFAISEGNKKNRAYGLMIMSIIARIRAEYDLVPEYMAQSLSLFREVDDLFGIAAVLNDRGIFANQRGQFATAQADLQECLELMQRIGSQRPIAVALCNLGLVAMNQGNYTLVRQHFEESLAIIHRINDRNTLVIGLIRMGYVMSHLGAFSEAHTYLKESIAVAPEAHNQTHTGQSLIQLGSIAAATGDFATAVAYLEEAITVGQKVAPWIHSAALLAQGNLFFLQANYAAAHQCYDESLALLANHDEPWRRAQVHAKLGTVLVYLNELDKARQLLHDVLRVSWTMGAIPVVLDALLGFAVLLLSEGNPAKSTALCSMIDHHQATSAVDTKPWLNTLVNENRVQLSPEEYATACELGVSWVLAESVDELLAKNP